MAAPDNTIVLRVQLDEEKTEQRLAALVLEMEKTRNSQVLLNNSRKLGNVESAVYAQKTVELTMQLKGQQGEQAALTKNLDLYKKAVNGVGDSYASTQAALSLAIRQQQELAGSAGDTSEASQALTKQIAAYREVLSQTDEKQGAFFRNIGNYPSVSKGVEPLVQQIVHLQEAIKDLPDGSEQALAGQKRLAVGFEQLYAKAASEGQSLDDVQGKLKDYGESIRPAVAELVKLERAQDEVAKSAGEESQAFAEIGFKIGVAKKAIAEVPPQTEKLSTSLLGAAQNSQLFGGAINQLTGYKEKFTKATELAKVAIGGEVTALGLLKLALIATGLGLLVVVLGSVVTFLTKTQAGTDLLDRKMAAFGAVVRVVTNLIGDLGGKLLSAAEDPKQAFSDLVDFIETNLGNRLKSFGVLLDAIRNRDFKKLADGAIQFTTGITNATDKAKAFAGEIDAAATAGERLSIMQRRLERDTNDNIDTNKKLLNEVERLKNVRDNEFNTLAVRQKANEDAYKVELQRESRLVQLAREKVSVKQAELDLAGGRGRNEELFKELQEAANELKDIQEDAAGKQNELITNRYQLAQELADKEIALRKTSLDNQTAQLAKQLQTVRLNSDEELDLLKQKLELSRQAELNVKKLTAAQKRAIDARYESESFALTLDFNRRRLTAALQNQADLTAAALAGQQAGGDEVLRLQAEQIEQQRRLSIAALASNTDNSAALAKTNATAANQQRQLEYGEATRLLNDYLDNQRTLIERDHAAKVTNETVYQQKLAALAKAGTQAQAVINQDYRQDNAENQKKADANEVEAVRKNAEETKQAELIKQGIKETTLQAAQAYTETIVNLFGEESEAGKAALALQKVIGLAQIALNLQKQLALISLAAAEIKAIPIIGPALGTAYEIAEKALAITSAAAGAAAILKLEQGGIAQGPSHEQGGIPLYYRGRPAGIEIEGGEPVLHRGVSQNPLLLSLASTVNQLAGGRALVANLPLARMALGGIAPDYLRQQLAGNIYQPAGQAPVQAAGGPSAKQIGVEVASALKGVKVKATISDVKAGLARDAYTGSISDS